MKKGVEGKCVCAVRKGFMVTNTADRRWRRWTTDWWTCEVVRREHGGYGIFGGGVGNVADCAKISVERMQTKVNLSVTIPMYL